MSLPICLPVHSCMLCLLREELGKESKPRVSSQDQVSWGGARFGAKFWGGQIEDRRAECSQIVKGPRIRVPGLQVDPTGLRPAVFARGARSRFQAKASQSWSWTKPERKTYYY